MKKSSVIAIVVILLIIGGAAFMMMKKDDNSSNTTSSDITSSTPTDETHSEEPPTETAAESSSVTIESFAYGPETITVKKGTTVTWTNKDSVGHTVTPDEESANFKASELLGQGDTYSFTFETAGTYSYHCKPHPNMKAKVVVTE